MPKKVPSRLKSQILAEIKSGVKWKVVANKYNVSEMTLSRWLKEPLSAEKIVNNFDKNQAYQMLLILAQYQNKGISDKAKFILSVFF